MHYLVRRNAYGDLLFWNSRAKGFRYDGGSSYASLDSAKMAFRAIIEKYKVQSDSIEIMSHESILNHYNTVTSLD